MSGRIAALEGVFAGLSTEINANSPRGPAISGGAVLGLDLHKNWAFGIKAAYNPNLYTTGAFEPAGMLRYYLLPGCFGPFAQVEAGCIIIFTEDKSYYVFSGGLASGWRFNFGMNGFLEPAFRMGYPFLWGLSITAGVRFKAAKSR